MPLLAPVNDGPDGLRHLLATDRLLMMPGCFDAMSAKLIEAAGCALCFVSGFAVATAKLGLPDTGLLSYGEILSTVQEVCTATRLPVIADGDTGHGNEINVQRTVQGYARAGCAAIMIEDQLAPKRCGHTRGKQVVSFELAVARIEAAVDARKDGPPILILARTDARATDGMEEALRRARAFQAAGADILFVEAPQSMAEMEQIVRQVPGVHMANLIEGGRTPLASATALKAMGYRIAVYPLSLLNAAIVAMRQRLRQLQQDRPGLGSLMSFEDLQEVSGFKDYYELEEALVSRTGPSSSAPSPRSE